MKFFSVAFALFFSTLLYAEHHKIVFLASTPRSLSTAFVRTMQARGDMAIFNEPAQQAWMPTFDLLTPNWYRTGTLTTHKDVVDQLLNAAQTTAVFAKDQSFVVKDLLIHDDRLAHDPDVSIVFLLRNPHHAIISFYKKIGGIVNDFSLLLGYKSSYELFLMVKEMTRKIPVIVLTESLYTNPEATLRTFCDQVNIPFLAHALTWQSLGDNFEGVEEWHETKNYEVTHHRHKDAILSTHFKQPTQYEVDDQGHPTFSEINNPDDRQQCKKIYEESMVYYHAILNTHNN